MSSTRLTQTLARSSGLPTMVFVPVARDKPALVRGRRCACAVAHVALEVSTMTVFVLLCPQRTEGLLPAATIVKIVKEELS